MSILDDAREGMDLAVRPQDDLFGHVNGRWLEETDIPADRSSWGPFVQLADVAEEQVHAIIEDLAKVARDSDPGTELNADAQKIGDLFASFMDTDRIDRLGTRPIRPLVDAVAALRDTRDVAAFLGEFERVGGHGLFGSYVNTDDRNSDRYLFHLVQGGLGLPDESYYRDEKFASIREAYVAYLATVLRLIDVEGGDPEAGARTVLQIDTKLAAGHWERAETRDVQKTYNLKTVAELRELCPGFDWDVYVTNLSASAHESDELLFEVCVRQPSYFEHLSTVLGEVAIEDWRTWLLTRVLRSSAPYLTDDFVEANFDFYGRTLNGTPELRARWKRGVALVEGAVGEAVGKEYVARHFPRGVTAETLGELKPIHPELDSPTVTAGNASGINDAAAAVVLTSDDYADAHGLRSLGRIVSWANAGVDPARTGMGPTVAIPRALERAGLTLDDIDLIEINEAFCSVPVAAIRTLGLDPAIVNVNGSGCSLGHPIAATGARMVTTMIHELRRRGKSIGLLSMCAGGGMGSALVVEAA